MKKEIFILLGLTIIAGLMSCTKPQPSSLKYYQVIAKNHEDEGLLDLMVSDTLIVCNGEMFPVIYTGESDGMTKHYYTDIGLVFGFTEDSSGFVGVDWEDGSRHYEYTIIKK